jgi:hypothetical protein
MVWKYPLWIISRRTLPGPTEREQDERVDHGELVNDDGIGLKGVLGVVHELAGFGVELQQAVDGRGLAERALFDALGRPAGGGGDQDRALVGLEDLDDGADDGRFARARAAGDDGQPVPDRCQSRLLLLGGELQGQLFEHRLEIDRQLLRGRRLLGQPEEALGRVLFDELVLRLEDAGFRDGDAAQLGALEQLCQHGEHVAVGDVQQPGAFFQQFILRDIQVAALELPLIQDKKNAGTDALRFVLGDAAGTGDGVGDLEAHAAHALDQQVGVALDQRRSQVAEFTVDAENDLLADTERGEAHGQVAQGPAVAHALLDGRHDLFVQSRDLTQPFGSVFQDRERVLAEAVNDLLGRLLADALESPRRKIIDDALAVAGADELETADLDLLAEARVFGFLAIDLQEIAFTQGKKAADDHPALPGTVQRHFKNAEARILGDEDLAADLDLVGAQINCGRPGWPRNCRWRSHGRDGRFAACRSRSFP